jgi:hypothetical protein
MVAGVPPLSQRGRRGPLKPDDQRAGQHLVSPEAGRRPLGGRRRARFNRDDSNAGVSGLPGERSGDGVFSEATPETDRLDGLFDLGGHERTVVQQLNLACH